MSNDTTTTSNAPLWQRMIPTVGIIVLIMILLFVVKWQHDILNTQKDASIVEMKQLRDDIVRAQSQYLKSGDLEAFAKKSNIDLAPIKDDLSKLNAEIKGISNVTVVTPGYSGSNLSSSSVSPRLDSHSNVVSDSYGYLTHSQSLTLNESTADKQYIPFGEVQFHAWEAKPWNLNIYSRSYQVTSVLGQDENGKHYTYHKFTIISNGQSYPLKITDAKFAEEKPDSKFRFSPRIYLAVDAGGYVYPVKSGLQPEVMPSIQVSFFSYGETKINPVLTFLGLGLGYGSQTKSIGFILNPIRYNVAQHLPLIENLYIGPSFALSTIGEFAILGGIGVGL